MTSTMDGHDAAHGDRLVLFALSALSAPEAREMEGHVAECTECRAQLSGWKSVVDSFVAWPRPVVRPTAPLSDRLARRLGVETSSAVPPEDAWQEPPWEEASPGLWYQLLSKDAETDRVTMLVRLEPGVEYPPHDHAGLEELHLLDGELWIDDRKLYPGDYNRAERGTGDSRVWSETGCTCVLITSHRDVLK
jgi:anti-sigma factor ChrR (cupin superfamily)